MMVNNPELHKITTFDGVEFLVNDNVTKIILSPTPADMGLPNIDWQTRRAYQQYGESVVAFNLRPRTLRLEFQQGDCTREEFFAARKNLLDFLHPLRGGDLTYTFIREDDTQRAIRGRAIGPSFSGSSRDVYEEMTIEDDIIIECFDPIWFDPTCLSAEVGSQITGDHLVFPAYFPDEWLFQIGDVVYQFSVTYTGTWFALPVISITGPCNSFLLEHVTLNKFISYARPLPAGETLALNLNDQTLINDTDGVDYWPFLASTSDLDRFRLEINPVVGGGVNQFEFQLTGATADSAIVLQYQRRYMGI